MRQQVYQPGPADITIGIMRSIEDARKPSLNYYLLKRIVGDVCIDQHSMVGQGVRALCSPTDPGLIDIITRLSRNAEVIERCGDTIFVKVFD